MPWPTPKEYNEALQTPRIAFADSELRSGQPELDPLGLPRARSGSFATVYKLRCGQRDWAARCFLREFPDQEERYAAIHEHLQRVQLPHMALFEFIRQGILVRGHWYPILKMEWLNGDSLDSYVKKHVRNPQVLRDLAGQWLQMLSALQRASITHGDLQHGNILMINGRIRLIDYDGMYVPALAGRGSHEVGHRNYQHPARSESHFGPNIDNFSAWVIALALLALSEDPTLWDRFGGGDESILFRREDFERPESSALLRALQTSADARTRLPAQLFESLLRLPPDQIPSLDGNLLPAPRYAPPDALGLSWIKDHVTPPRGPTAEKDQLTPRYPDLTWIFDWKEEATPPSSSIRFTNSLLVDRLAVLTSALVLSSAAFFGGFQIVSALYGFPIAFLVLMNAALLFFRYRSDPAMDEIRELRARTRKVDDELNRLTAEVEGTARQKDNHRKQGERYDEQLVAQQRTTERQEQVELQRAETSIRAALAAVDQRWQAVRQAEAQALQRIQDNLGTNLAAMQGELSGLKQAEATEIANALHVNQLQHIQRHLTYHRIQTASIPRVGATFKARLLANQFATAADVSYHAVQRVPGIGHSRAAAIEAWRAAIEANARRTMPTTLAAAELANVRAKYQSRQRQIEQDISLLDQRRRAEEAAVRGRSQADRAPIEKERTNLHEERKREVEAIRSRYRPQYAAIRQQSVKFAAETQTKLREADRQIQQITARLGSLHFQREGLRRERSAVAHISFPNYLKMVLSGLKAA